MTEISVNTGQVEYEDVDPDENLSEDSILNDLKNEVLADKEEDIKWYTVPARESIELAFSTNLDFDTLRAMFKRATVRKTKELDPIRLAHAVLSNQTRGIRVKGHNVTKDGSELTLLSPQIWQMFNVNSMPQAIKKIMKFEGHIVALMQEVLDDAGYGDVDVESEDPLNMG